MRKKAVKKSRIKEVLKERKGHREAHHEARHHAAPVQPHHAEKTEKKTNKGIKILIDYSIILCLIYLLYFILGIFKPELLFLGGLEGNTLAIMIDFILLAALIYIIYGLRKRHHNAWWLCMAWYAASIINSVWSVYIMKSNVYNILYELLVMSSVFIVLINALIIWYVYSKRAYFTGPHHDERLEKKDRAFIYSLACFWVLLILLSMNIGYDFYKDTTRMADSIIQELKDTTPLHAIDICETKEGNEKDICFVVFVTIFEKYDLTPVCSRIESDLYRFSCMQANG